MKISEFIQKKGESLKRMGAIFWILNRIENEITMHITIFFTDWSGNHQWKSIIFNRALFNEKIYLTLENKRQLFLKIIQGLDEVARWKGVKFEEEKWSKICKSIVTIQEIRNNLAHNFLSFSDDGDKASFTDLKTPTGPYSKKEFDLNETLKNADELSEELMGLLPQFLEQAQVVMNAADPTTQKVN